MTGRACSGGIVVTMMGGEDRERWQGRTVAANSENCRGRR